VKYRVLKNGHPIHMTPKEFEMLHYLMMHAGEPIPHARLLKSVWGRSMGTNSSTFAHLSVNFARKSKTIQRTAVSADRCIRRIPI